MAYVNIVRRQEVRQERLNRRIRRARLRASLRVRLKMWKRSSPPNQVNSGQR